jgi:RNA polymerase sigma factor (sigma-70 family)
MADLVQIILVNHLASQRRQHRSSTGRPREVAVPREALLGWIDESPMPGVELARREREAVLTAALLRLPEHYRQVVIEHYREERTYEEIGRRRGISTEAVRKLWVRALGKLREEVGSSHECL